MGKYANRTCKECGIMRPIYRMEEIHYEVNSGRSGFSVSVSPFSSSVLKSTRIHSGRKYYSKRKGWVCKDREAHHNPSYYDDLEKAKAEAIKVIQNKIEVWKKGALNALNSDMRRVKRERALEEKKIKREKALEEKRIREEKKRIERTSKYLLIIQGTEETFAENEYFRHNLLEGFFASDQYKEVSDKFNKCMVNFPEKFNSSSQSKNMKEFIFDYLKFIPASGKRSIPVITQEIFSSDPYTKIINLSEFKRVLLNKWVARTWAFLLFLYVILDSLITSYFAL